jgi:hypothetical protein
MPTETPKEPESRRDPGDFAPYDAEDELAESARYDRSCASPERCATLPQARERNNRRNPRPAGCLGKYHEDATDEPGVDEVGHYRHGPDFAEMRQRGGQSGIGVEGR